MFRVLAALACAHVQAHRLVRNPNVSASGEEAKCLSTSQRHAGWETTAALVVRETPESSSLLQGRRQRLTQLWEQHVFGAYYCDDREQQDFVDVFGNESDSKGLLDKGRCRGNNVLFLYPRDDPAFELDAYACYRLMFWHDRACSVKLMRVESTEEAERVLQDFGPGSIRHLVLGGRGDGTSLRWGEGPLGKLQVQRLQSEQLLKLAGERMQDGGTVFLDSCLSATLHAMENLAHYVSRVMLSGMRESERTKGGTLTVTGSVHAFSSNMLTLSEDSDGTTSFVNPFGLQSYRTASQEETELAGHPAAGDWVLSYYHTSSGKSASPDYGYVEERQEGGRGRVAELSIRFQDRTLQPAIPCTWVTQFAAPKSSVNALLDGEGKAATEVILLGQATKSPASSRVLLPDGTEEVVPTKSVQPKLVQYSGPEGTMYAAVGDWVRVRLSDARLFSGVVEKQTKAGVQVRFSEGSPGHDFLGKGLSDDIDVKAIKAVARRGMSVLVRGSRSQRLSGLLASCDSSSGGCEVVVKGSTLEVEPEQIVSVQSEGKDVWRTATNGCECKPPPALSFWTQYSTGKACSWPSVCCNPDNDPQGEWCLLEDPSCAKEHKSRWPCTYHELPDFAAPGLLPSLPGGTREVAVERLGSADGKYECGQLVLIGTCSDSGCPTSARTDSVPLLRRRSKHEGEETFFLKSPDWYEAAFGAYTIFTAKGDTLEVTAWGTGRKWTKYGATLGWLGYSESRLSVKLDGVEGDCPPDFDQCFCAQASQANLIKCKCPW